MAGGGLNGLLFQIAPRTRTLRTLRSLNICTVSPAVARQSITHKVTASECGRARRDHAFTGDWSRVACPLCLEAAGRRRLHVQRGPASHKARATACGRATSADGLSADWSGVTCPECMKRWPGAPVPICHHCHTLVIGRCVHVTLKDAWLHDRCVEAFKETAAGRLAFGRGSNPYATAKCPRCGRPGIHPDGQMCPNAP
jgi:hypothetical protein